MVGAPLDSEKDELSGAAYVFTRAGDVWTLQQKLTASDGDRGDQFGDSVAAGGDTVVVGAQTEESTYLFTRTAGGWTEQQQLTASDGEVTDEFRVSVAIDVDTLVIGARGDRSAYVFIRRAGVWIEHQKLTASDRSCCNLAWFGTSVAVDGDTAAIGAPL